MAEVGENIGVPSTAPETRGINVEATPDESGALVAGALQKAGDTAIQGSKFYSTIAAQEALNRAQQKKDTLLYGDPNKPGDTGFFGMTGADAMNARQETQSRLDEIDKDARDELQTPESLETYDNESRRYRFSADAQIGQHADQQQKVWALGTNETQATNALNMVGANPSNPDVVKRSLDSVTQAYVRQAQIRGDTDAQGAQLKARQAVMLTQLRSLTISDPGQALKLYNAGGDILGSLPDYDSLGRQVKEAAINSQMAPAVDAEIADVKTAAHASVTGSSGAPVKNNLGNVKTAGGGFANPLTPLDGVMLTANNLRSQDYRGLTLDQIAQKWAPASDHNDPKAWAANVSRVSGIAVGTVPNLDDPKVLTSLIQGISAAEKQPADQGAFTPQIIQQGVTASLAGRKAALGAPIAATGQKYPSTADYYAANSATILEQAQVHAERLFPNFPDAQERFVQNVNRSLNQTIAQQHQQYEVDAHVVQQALASDRPPINEQQLMTVSPEVGAAWRSMQVNDSLAAMHIENIFDANAKGRAANLGTQFSNMMNRVLAPVDDPNRITNASQLWAYVTPGEDGPLTNTGLARLNDMLTARGTPQGESQAAQLRQFFNQAHQSLSAQVPEMGFYDPKGEALYGKFLLQAFPTIQAQVAAGKTLPEVLSPKGDLYNSIFTFKRQTGQDLIDRILDTNRVSLGALTADPSKAALDPTKSQMVDRGVQAKQFTAAQAEQLKALMLDVQLKKLTSAQAKDQAIKAGIFPPEVPLPAGAH